MLCKDCVGNSLLIKKEKIPQLSSYSAVLFTVYFRCDAMVIVFLSSFISEDLGRINKMFFCFQHNLIPTVMKHLSL